MPKVGQSTVGYKLIQGDTYHVKERLKELGAWWDPDMKGWWLPDAKYDEARLIVDNCEGQMDFDDRWWDEEDDYARR